MFIFTIYRHCVNLFILFYQDYFWFDNLIYKV